MLVQALLGQLVCSLSQMHLCLVNRICWLFSVVPATLLWIWEADLNGLGPLPSGFILGLVNGEHSQKIRDRKENEFGLLVSPAPFHIGCPDIRPHLQHYDFSQSSL